MRIKYLIIVAALTLSACGTPPPAAQQCQTFIFANQCVNTRLSQEEWIAELHRHPRHAECAGQPVLSGYDALMMCESSMSGIDQLGSMPAGIPAPSVIVVAPRGW